MLSQLPSEHAEEGRKMISPGRARQKPRMQHRDQPPSLVIPPPLSTSQAWEASPNTTIWRWCQSLSDDRKFIFNQNKASKKLTMKWGSDISCIKMVFGESYRDKSSLLWGWNHSFSVLLMMPDKNVTTCSYTDFPANATESAHLPTTS